MRALVSTDLKRVCAPADRHTIKSHIAYVGQLVDRGGPTPADYDAFNNVLASVGRGMRAGILSKQEVARFRRAFGPALSLGTLQGFSYHKPHGYTGDFEIIDLMYQKHVTDDPALANWDRFFQAHSAPKAVRNRKTYIKRLLCGLLRTHPSRDKLQVLNVASGPMRDVYEFFEDREQHGRVLLEGVDYDDKAIAYARRLCKPFLDQLTFHNANALRFTTDRTFELIWSAGLFDYLSEKGFRFLLEHLLSMLRPDGELVIGNFSKGNPTRDYMEVVGDWYLHHRTADQLVALARRCGVRRENIRVGQEVSGINLFLHIKRAERFISL